MAQPDENRETPVDNGEDVITLDDVTMEVGNVDFQDRVGVVAGDICRGATLRGSRDISVKGQVQGVPETRCVVESLGTLHLAQSAVGARLSGRSVTIVGSVENCQIQSDSHAEVHGDVLECQVSVGGHAADIRELNRMLLTQRALEQKTGGLRVQTAMVARKFMRDYPQVNLKMGNILVPQNRQLKVNLHQFYSAFEGEDPDKIDRGLGEFYMRVIVGMLTRNNQHYISQNPSRQKVFLRLIEDLRKHVLRIRELDKIESEAAVLRKRCAMLKKNLEAPGQVPYLQVGGSVGVGVTVHFVALRGFQETSGGALDVSRLSLEARVVAIEGTDDVGLEVCGDKGDKAVLPVPGGKLHNGSFVVKDDRIVWVAED